MQTIRILAVAVATGRIGYVYFEDQQLAKFEISRKGFEDIGKAASTFEEWLKRTRPNIVVTEKINDRCRKGERSRQIIQTISVVASHHYVHDICIPMQRNGRTRYEQAVHFSQIYPEISERLPQKNKSWQSEDRAMILFDALTLAHPILENPTVMLAASLDKSTDDRSEAA